MAISKQSQQVVVDSSHSGKPRDVDFDKRIIGALQHHVTISFTVAFSREVKLCSLNVQNRSCVLEGRLNASPLPINECSYCSGVVRVNKYVL